MKGVINYKQIFTNTIDEFITDLSIMLPRNEAINNLDIGWRMGGSAFVPQILKTIKDMVKGKNAELFEKEQEEFFQTPLYFFDLIGIKNWFSTISDGERITIWRYLKTLKFLSDKI